MATLASVPDEVVSEYILSRLNRSSRKAYHCIQRYESTHLKESPLIKRYLAVCTLVRFMKHVVSINIHRPVVKCNKGLHGRVVNLYGLKNELLVAGIALHSTDDRFITGIGITRVVPHGKTTVYWSDLPSTWPVDYLRATFCEYFQWSDIKSVHIGPLAEGYTLDYYNWTSNQ